MHFKQKVPVEDVEEHLREHLSKMVGTLRENEYGEFDKMSLQKENEGKYEKRNTEENQGEDWKHDMERRNLSIKDVYDQEKWRR